MPSAEGDPSDLWLRAFMLFQQAEEFVKGQKDLQALSKYRESQRLFDYIARTHPLWRPQMVNHRRRAILDAVESVQGRLQSSDPVAMKAWEQQNRGTGTPEPAPAGPQVSPQIALQPREGIALEVPAPSAPITANPAPIPSLQGGAISDLSSEFQKQQAQIDLLTGANQRLEQTLRQQKDQASGLQGQLAQTREAEQRLQAQLARTVEELKQARATGGGQVAKLESQLSVAVEELKKWRRELSQDLGVPPFIIFNDATLYALAAALPVNKEEFMAVKGTGESRWERFGPKITQVCIMARAAGHQPAIGSLVRRGGRRGAR
jgi:hypothetical protein